MPPVHGPGPGPIRDRFPERTTSGRPRASRAPALLTIGADFSPSTLTHGGPDEWSPDATYNRSRHRRGVRVHGGWRAGGACRGIAGAAGRIDRRDGAADRRARRAADDLLARRAGDSQLQLVEWNRRAGDAT